MSYEDYQNLHVRREQGVSFVTIDHPPMNLMNREMVRQLSRFLDEVEQDHAVRVIVFESALPGFFLGNFDLQGLQPQTRIPFTEHTRWWCSYFKTEAGRLSSLRKRCSFNEQKENTYGHFCVKTSLKQSEHCPGSRFLG